MQRCLIFFVSCIFFILSNIATGKELLVDNDAGIDDVLALWYLLNRPDVDVKAITIAGDGSAHCGAALKTIHKLLTFTHHLSLPYACGRETPLVGHHHFPQAVLHESDSLAGAVSFKSSAAVKQTAVELLFVHLQKAKTPLDILAIGPLTNIAELLLSRPTLKNKIHKIYVMGGAIHVPGNLKEVDLRIQNNVAEWNIYLDPYAARVVFNSGIPIVLVPLDVTNQLPIDMNFYHRVKNNLTTRSARWIDSLLQRNQASLHAHTWYFWDPLAAVIATNESIAVMKKQPLRVVLHPENESGALVQDQRSGHRISVCTAVDKIKFASIWQNAIIKKCEGALCRTVEI